LEDLSDTDSVSDSGIGIGIGARKRQFGRTRTVGAYGNFARIRSGRAKPKGYVSGAIVGGGKNVTMRSQRGTFVFDRVLYRDSIIEITPSGVFFLRNYNKKNKKCIDIMDIDNVHIRAHISVPLLKPTWRQRFSWSNNVRARAPLTGRIPNVLLDIKGYGIMGIFVDRPMQVKEAILSARSNVY